MRGCGGSRFHADGGEGRERQPPARARDALSQRPSGPLPRSSLPTPTSGSCVSDMRGGRVSARQGLVASGIFWGSDDRLRQQRSKRRHCSAPDKGNS